MRTRLATLAASVIVVVLAGLPTAALAQDPEPLSSALVTGTVVEQSGYTTGVRVQDGEEGVGPRAHLQWEADGVFHEQGHLLEQWVEWSDPRLPAEHWIRLDLAGYGGDDPETGVTVVQTSHLLEGADGDWRGTGRAFETSDDRYSYYVLTGEGAYEGLHALLRGTPGMDAHGPVDWSYEGWVFEGPLPAFPEPVEPATWEGFQMVPPFPPDWPTE